MIRFIILILCEILLISCKRDSQITSDWYLEKSGSKTFILDDNTGPISPAVTYLRNNDSYIHFNEYDSKFLIYNYKDEALIKKVFLKSDYPIRYLSYYNNDSIICFTGYPVNRIIITDTANNEKLVVDTGSRLFSDSSIITCENYNPVKIKGSKLFFTSVTLTEKDHNRKFGGVFDLISGERIEFVQFPVFYSKANWGYTNFRYLFHCFDSSNMIVSFPASHYLYIYNLNTFKRDSILASSKYFNGIKPFSRKKDIIQDLNKSARYYASTPSYRSIYYDNYRNVYYRIAELPKKKKEFNPDNLQESLSKPRTIIVLDSNFNKICETEIGSIYNVLCTLITPDGLLIIRKDETEDAVFDIFKLRRKV